METVFIDQAGQPIPEQRRLIRSIEHLKRVLRRPGITLERLDFNGYRASSAAHDSGRSFSLCRL
jgi:hypothetical protein